MENTLFNAIREGGNLSAAGKYGVKSATKLQMTKFTPEMFESFKTDFMAFLLELNDRYEEKTGRKCWPDEKFLQSGACFSGSTRTFFQKDFVSYSEFKKKVGDFDVQCPEAEKGVWTQFIKEMEDVKIGPFTIYGNTSNFAQDHSLVETDQEKYPGVGSDFLQVDWEYVPFKDGQPTEFATFAHYSSWEDMEQGVKGLFVKILLRAIAHSVRDYSAVEVSAKTGKVSTTHGQKKINPYSRSFSVDKGLRNKLRPWIDPETGKQGVDPETGRLKVYSIKTVDSTFTQDVDTIFSDMMGRPPKSPDEKRMLYSYVRCLRLIKDCYSPDRILGIFDEFADLLLGPNAQKLSAFDKDEDREWKMTAIKKFFEVFPDVKAQREDEVADMAEDFYSTYVNRERDSEASNSRDETLDVGGE